MNKNKLSQMFVSSIMLIPMCSIPVLAQETVPTGQKGYAVEEIIVTARRVKENLQKTPVAISAFSGDALERRQIDGTDDLSRVTPNLEFTNNAPLAGNNASAQVYIRGIGQSDPTAGVDPGVGLYIDDVYMGQSVGGTMELRDIDGIQVLRGPQGTLFGRNTIGGAVLISTTRPGSELGGKLKIGTGSDGLQQVFGAVDLPVSDDFKTRFSYGSRKQDGYVTRISDGVDLGDTNNYTFTAKAEWNVTDSLIFKLNYDYTKADENGSPLVFATNDPTATFQRVASSDAGCPGFNGVWNSIPSVPDINDNRCANHYQNKGPYANNGTYPLESKLENKGVSFRAEYNVTDHLLAKYIFSKRNLVWSGNRDADNTPLDILHTNYDSDGDQSSHEIQLIYTGDKLTGVTGFYTSEMNVSDELVATLNAPPPGLQLDSNNNIIENENWAVFTQWTYALTDQFSATLGVRRTEETKASTPDQFSYANPAVKYVAVEKYEADFSKDTISASVNYKITDNNMVYASYSEGFKGGGWNSRFNRVQTQTELDNFHQFNEETAKTTEIGYKTDFLDNTMRFNAALFSTDYTDLQFIFRVGVAPYLLNAGKASIDGGELELTWVPNERWIVEASLGYLKPSIDAISTDFVALGASTSITTKNTLPYTPEMTSSLGVGYNISFSGFTVSPRVDLSYRDRTYFDTANTIAIAQMDTVLTVDAGIQIQPESEQWNILIAVKNATDEEYPIAGNSALGTSSGYAEIAYARPREYAVTLTYKF